MRLSEIVVKSLKRVPDERQTHLGRLFGLGAALARLKSLSLENSGVVCLINFVCWEVGCVDVGGESGLEWRSDASQAVEIDTTEECVALELMGATSPKSILSIAHHTVGHLSATPSPRFSLTPGHVLPSDQILCLDTECNVIWEVQCLSPVDNLAIRVMAVLGTERWPAHQTLEHDSS